MAEASGTRLPGTGAAPWENDSVRFGRLAGAFLPYRGRSVSVEWVNIECARVVLSFRDQSPRSPLGFSNGDWLPAPGRYPIRGGVIPFETDTVRAYVTEAPAGVGWWPFAGGGASLDARDGWLELKAVSRERVVGRFWFTARRRARS